MAVAIAVIAFWLGVFSVLFAEAVLIYVWFVSKKVVKRPAMVDLKPKLTEVVEEIAHRVSQDGCNAKETCEFINVGLTFIFQELRDSLVMKRFIMRRIQKEFEDFMMTKTQGKIVEQLTVRDYSLGREIPVFHSAQLTNIKRNDTSIENIEITLDVEYEGGAEISIDADLILGKCAFVSVKISRVKGQGRLQFTRQPFTNWSFSFYDTPELQLEVDCLLDGRQFNQLSGFLESQIHKWVKKRHTLPNFKPRFLPFFPQPIPRDQRIEVYLHDDKLTVGQLMVELIECSHLNPVQSPGQLYCSLQLAEGPTQPLSGMWRTLWPVVECSVSRPVDGAPIGATFVESSWKEREEEKHELVVVRSVKSDSPAGNAGICKGDVLYSINHMKVSTTKSVVKLLHKISTERFLFTLMRPPNYAQYELLARAQKKQRKHHTVSSTDGAELVAQDADKLAAASPHMKKKMAKHYLKQEDKQLLISEHVDPSEYLMDRHQSEVKLRRQAASFTDYTGSLDESRMKNVDHKEQFTRSTSTISSRSIDHVDPLLTTDSSVMDCVDSVTNQQLTGNRDIHVTSRRSACQDPSWEEKFLLSVLPDHHYLNIILWCQLEDEKDYAVAHVSISLVDIAVQCLSKSSCTHTQRYVMLPNETVKFGSSRPLIKLTGSRGNIVYEGVYAGDILLRLTHSTKYRVPPDVDMTTPTTVEQAEHVDHNSDYQGLSDCSDEEGTFSGEHVLLQNEPAERLKTNHDFQQTEVKHIPARCEICKKKFWRNRVLQCIHCKLFCHKRCKMYCMQHVPCYRKTSGYCIVKDDGLSGKVDEFDHSISSQLDQDNIATGGHKLECNTSSHIDQDDMEKDTTITIHEQDIECSSISSLDRELFSDTETDQSDGEVTHQMSALHVELQRKLNMILSEMDSIKSTYNELGMTTPTNDQEAASITATQEKLSGRLDALKQEMEQCLNRLLDEDNMT